VTSVVAHLAEFGHQLDALRLAARQRRAGLAQRQVAQAHVLQQLQRVSDAGMRREELHRIVDLHLQHVADALAPPGDGQRLPVEARAAALVAGHLHVGQEGSSRWCCRPWPSQPGQRPAPVLKLKRLAA
jgi:hypothetical protein